MDRSSLIELARAAGLGLWQLQGRELLPVVQGGMGVGVSAGGFIAAGTFSAGSNFGTGFNNYTSTLNQNLLFSGQPYSVGGTFGGGGGLI